MSFGELLLQGTAWTPFQYKVPFELYPGGEVRLGVIHRDLLKNTEKVVARLESNDAIMALCQLVDVFHQEKFEVPDLVMPYIPYARQDRAKTEVAGNQSVSALVFADILNSMGWPRVTVIDPHSDVSWQAIENVRVIDRLTLSKWILESSLFKGLLPSPLILAPDAGAASVCKKIADYYKLPFAEARKHRNMATGQLGGVIGLTGEPLLEKDVLIFDDICDGGRTFINLEQEVRREKPKSVHLVVTHGIFSKGLEPLQGFDSVSCHYPFKRDSTTRLDGWNPVRFRINETTVPGFYFATKNKQ